MFDAYHKWLGILPKDQPPNHYRLLSLELFESDLDVIEGAADRQMGFIRQYQSGEHAADAARILNELAAARLCLLKPPSKSDYDQKLRQQRATSKGTESQAPSDDPFALMDTRVEAPLRKKRKSRRKAPSVGANRLIAVGVGAVVCVLGLIIFRGAGAVSAPNQANNPASRPPESESRSVNAVRTPDTAVSESGVQSGERLATTPVKDVALSDSNSPSESSIDRSGLVIRHAEFGAGDKWFDLTNRLRAAATPRRLVMAIDSALVGGDPLFGAVKHLKLRYRLDGHEYEEWYCEGNVVQLDERPIHSAKNPGDFQIHEARFGGGILGETQWADVADRVRGKIEQGRLRCPVRSLVQDLAISQASGFRALFIRYSLGGEVLTCAVREDDIVDLGERLPDGDRDHGPTDRSALAILEAKYGANETWVDVSPRFGSAAESGRLFVTATVDTFSRTDPVPYVQKVLRMRFRMNGRMHERTYCESSLLFLDTRPNTPHSSSGSSLQVLEAHWGRGILGEKTWVDVTGRVKILDGKINSPIAAITQNVPDPVVGSKVLFVRYSIGGDIRTICVSDKGDLKLGD